MEIIVESTVEKTRWERAKEKAKRAKRRISDWCYDHKVGLIMTAPVIITGIKQWMYVRARTAVIDHKEKVKEHRIYDRSEGHYWELRREPTNAEWYVIKERRVKGEKLVDILEDLRLLR